MGGSSGGGNSTSNVRQSGTTEVINSNIPKEFYPYLQKQMQMADACCSKTMFHMAVSV